MAIESIHRDTPLLTIILKQPGQAAHLAEVEQGLEAMQIIVHGNIECLNGGIVGLPVNVDIWFNDEGKLQGLPSNLAFIADDEIFDVGVGPIFFTGTDGQGETISLPPEHHAAVLAYCQRYAC